jgi:hypothetical protein
VSLLDRRNFLPIYSDDLEDLARNARSAVASRGTSSGLLRGVSGPERFALRHFVFGSFGGGSISILFSYSRARFLADKRLTTLSMHHVERERNTIPCLTSLISRAGPPPANK